jgi:predicted amidohydrolase
MSIKLELVQFAPVLGDSELNIDKMKKYVENSTSQIIVFPELATSGYFFTQKDELEAVALESTGEVIEEFQDLAEENEQIIIFGFPEIEGEEFYNSAVILLPDKSLSSIYRKSHLFYKESKVFEPGNTGFFTIDYQDWDLKIGIMICYDWRFPEAARTLALQGADLIVCPANLVTGVWQGVMQARALENKVYMAVCNRIGSEKKDFEKLDFNGESTIISYNGKPLCTSGEDNEISIVAEIYPDKTRDKSFNEFNNIFEDRRPELYFAENDEEIDQ